MLGNHPEGYRRIVTYLTQVRGLDARALARQLGVHASLAVQLLADPATWRHYPKVMYKLRAAYPRLRWDWVLFGTGPCEAPRWWGWHPTRHLPRWVPVRALGFSVLLLGWGLVSGVVLVAEQPPAVTLPAQPAATESVKPPSIPPTSPGSGYRSLGHPRLSGGGTPAP